MKHIKSSEYAHQISTKEKIDVLSGYKSVVLRRIDSQGNISYYLCVGNVQQQLSQAKADHLIQSGNIEYIDELVQST